LPEDSEGISAPVFPATCQARFPLHIREKLSEEQLVGFDILTRPCPDVSVEERTEVKKVAKNLLEKLKALLVLYWRQKAAARSQVKLAIEDLLDDGLPRSYTPDVFKQKCAAVFEHVYETYGDRGAGLYSAAPDAEFGPPTSSVSGFGLLPGYEDIGR
jgi:hypothetical protein